MRFLKVLAAAACLLPLGAVAQGAGGQAVKIVVPYAPGGGVDVLARVLAERLQQKWGRPVIVENKAGASTIIGTTAVTKALPDGQTLLLTSEATITSNPFLFAKLPYDPVRELTPISQLVSLPQMVIAHPSVTANSMAELVQQTKARPDGLAYASYGSGSLPHLLFEGLRNRTGIALTHVPYKGIAPAVSAVLSGEVQLSLAGVPAALAHIKAGTLKPLALARKSRLPALPQVPTLQELGYQDIDTRESWFGLFVTAGTPDKLVQKIAQDVAEIGADPQFRERHVLSRGFDPVFSTPEAFAQFIQADMRLKANLIRISGAKAD